MANNDQEVMGFSSYQIAAVGLGMLGMAFGAEPLPLSSSYWKDAAFKKSFNGSYRIEARIEPVVSTEERGLLVTVQGLMEKGERKAALKVLNDSKLTAKSTALRFNLGNLYFEEGEVDEAIKAYEGALEDYPSFRRAHRNLAMALVRKDELEKALIHLIEAMRLGDSDGSTYGLLGYCRVQRGEWASALQSYRMAQLSQPDMPEWKAGVAQCLQNLNAKDEAVVLLDEVIRQRPEVTSYATLQASILLELGRSEDAVKSLELPRRLGSLDSESLLLLADLHLRAGRLADAKEVMDEAFAAEIKPSMGRVISVVGSAMALGEWELAEVLVGKASPEGGEQPKDLRRLAARLKIESKKAPEEGAEELRKLVGDDPTDGMALMALGKYEVSRGNGGVAELLFERAAVVDETAADAWVELARLRVEERRYASALDAVDRALELRPGGELQAYREALTKLVEAAN